VRQLLQKLMRVRTVMVKMAGVLVAALRVQLLAQLLLWAALRLTLALGSCLRGWRCASS
jgi:hypothetical protein